MSIGMKSRTKAKSKKASASKTSAPLTQELEQVAAHVVGKPTEVEPRESSALPAEAAESAMQSSEAPDAGYGRCTESSDWENRGRS